MKEIIEWINAEGTGHYFFIAFPICLLILFILLKGKRLSFLVPSLVMTLVIVNPWFYQKWTDLGLYAYWRILWVVPVVPIVASLIPSVTEKIERTWIKGVIALVGIGMIAIGGAYLYTGAGGNFTKAANAAKLPDYVVNIGDKV